MITTITKIPSQMDVAPRYKLLTLLTPLTLLTWLPLLTLFKLSTLLTLFILLKLLYTAKTLASMPIYIVREGWNAIGMGRSASEQNV